MFPRLLICEGPKDAVFFHKLIEIRGLPRFHIQPAGGNGQFSNAISKFQLERTKVYKGVRDILIVADNDDVPAESFANVCSQIDVKFGAGAAPRAPLEVTKGRPRCTVLMVPWTDREGNLESLCVDAARNADRDVGGHVDYFLALLAADRWASPSRVGKAWLRSNLAGRCESDPFIPLGRVFNERRHENLIPVGDGSFDRIADVLRSIGRANRRGGAARRG